MAIQRIPSFWDYLGRGIDKYTEAREAKKDREMRERQAKLGELSFLTNLYGQGALDSGSLRDQINQSGLGLPQVDIMPSAAERRQKILSRPDTEISVPSMSTMGAGIPMPTQKVKIKGSDTATDDERTAAGLPSIADRTQQNLANRRTQVDLRKTEADMETSQRINKDAQLKNAAGQFISMVLGRMGPAARQNPEAAAEAAFNEYKRMLSSSRFGGLPPADEAYARVFFSKAMRDAIMEERSLEVQERVASGKATEMDLRFRQLTTLRESARKELDDMEANSRFGAIISMYRGQPLEAVPMSFRGLMQAHAERVRYIQQIDDRLNNLMPTGLNRPTGSVQDIQVPPKVQNAIQMIKDGKATLDQLKQAEGKTFTKEEIAQVEAALRGPTKPKPTTPRKHLTDTTASKR